MKKLKFFSVLMLIVMSVPFIASCGSDDKTPEYVGKWYRDKYYNSGNNCILTFVDIQENSYTYTIYYLTGKYLDTATMAEISNVKKETKSASLNRKNDVFTITLGGETKDVKYSIWNGNQLVLTDVKTGDLYGVLKVNDDVQKVVDQIDKIAVYEKGLEERIAKIIN